MSNPRFTRDIDLAVAVTDDVAAESLVTDFVAAGFRLRLSLEQQALGRLAAVRLLSPGQHQKGIVIDLLFASSGIEPEICRDAERLDTRTSLAVGEPVPMPRAPAGRDRAQTPATQGG